jgi:lysophospholipase L1-like esterase
MGTFGLRVAQPLSLLVLPALLPQMLWVKRRTPTLPEAEGVSGEVAGEHPALRLAVVGDSMAAGVGVAHHSAGLAGQLAERMAAETGRRVVWRVVARSGATARSTARKLAKSPPLFPAATEAGAVVPPQSTGADAGAAVGPDVVVVLVGINDLLRLRGLSAWRQDIQDLVATLRSQVGPEAPVGFSGMPPVWRFPALPQPLRAVLGLRARLMEHTLRESTRDCGAFCVRLPVDEMADDPRAYFAADRFHPSARGYSAVATAFVPPLMDTVRTRC